MSDPGRPARLGTPERTLVAAGGSVGSAIVERERGHDLKREGIAVIIDVDGLDALPQTVRCESSVGCADIGPPG